VPESVWFENYFIFDALTVFIEKGSIILGRTLPGRAKSTFFSRTTQAPYFVLIL
jgi:hypothetical protein